MSTLSTGMSGGAVAAVPTDRDAGDDDAPLRARAPIGDRWAVVVGISDYADHRLSLRYAHRDATELHDFLLTPAGGAFTSERICLSASRRRGHHAKSHHGCPHLPARHP
jgi:hypothetical protein